MQNQSEEKNSESISIPGSADNIGLGMVLSNETWEHLVNASPGFVAFISPDLKILNMNIAMATFLGGTPDQFIGKLCYEALHNSNEPFHECPLIKAVGNREVCSSIIEDKTFGRALVKVIPIQTNHSSLAGCLHFVEPIENPSLQESQSVIPERAMYSLVNAMPNPTLICDTSGKIILASAGFIEMIGISDPTAYSGSNFVSFLIHDDIERALLNFNTICQGAKSRAIGQFMVRRARRDSILTEVIMSVVTNPGHSISSIMLTFSDISGQIELEESANKNHIRLSRFNKTFLNFSPEPSININRLIALLGEMLGASSCSYTKYEEERIIPFVSWQSPFMTDFTPDVVTGLIDEQFQNNPDDFVILVKPQLAAFLLANPLLQEKFGIKTLVGIAVKSGNKITGFITVVFTFNYQLKSDDREFCSMIASALALEGSRISAPLTTNVNDINYRELFDFFTDAIYILDHDGVFIDVNTGATRMYGYNREEMIGQTPLMLSATDKNDLDATNESIRKAFNGETQELEWWGRRKNGEVFPKDVVLNRGRYFGRDVVIAIGRDITERKQVEEKLLEYNLELRETNQSKDKFFSILAHDLKNPFGGLLGFIDLLYEDIDELSTDLVKEYLQNIRTASYHTYSLLENLLEWSRIQTGKVQLRPSKFELKEVIESVLLLLEANSIRKNITLVNKVEAGFVAEADHNMIHSVIQNLITNAIKFSNSNSQVIIDGHLAATDYSAGVEEESKTPARKWFEISITDSGIGIPEDILPKLFKLDGQFSMAGTANEPGTGLGLILCKEMVEKNGGHIQVESRLGHGSTFSFTVLLSE
jgi:two-component system, sensor histidine kinase and response regulator